MILQQVYDPLTEKFQRRYVGGQFYIPGAYCDQIQRLQLPLSDRHGLPSTPTSIGAILFDTQQDLLWIGTDSVSLVEQCGYRLGSDLRKGRIISYYGPELQRYTSLQAHPSAEGPMKQFLSHDRGVISIASRSIHLMSRRGLTQWHISFVGSDVESSRGS